MDKDEKLKDIIEYYDHTRYDYRTAWDDSDNPAVHFGFYDEHADKHKDALQNTNKTLAEFANIQKGEKVLDAGCGRGGSCFWLVKNIGAMPVGITPVQSQIDDCINKAIELKLADQCIFVNADYCQMPFEGESFDVVWACESLCHAEDKSLFYKEAYRVLKPGGRVIIAEYIRSDRPLGESNEQLLAEWLHNWAIPDIDTKEEHNNYATSVGFKDFKVIDYSSKVRVSLRNLYKKSKQFKHISKAWTYFTKRSKLQHKNLIGSIRQFEALEEGLWIYSLMLGVKQ